MEHKYKEGDRVYCFDPMLGRARILYEAKITSLVGRRNREPAYRVILFDWNKIYSDRPKKCSYDHHVPEEYLRPLTQMNERIMRKLYKAAADCATESDRIETVSHLLLQLHQERKLKELPPGIEVDTDAGDEQDAVVSNQNTADDEEVEIYLEIPEALIKVLEEDCCQVKVNHKIVQQQSDCNVVDILEAFLRHHANQLLYDRPKHLKDGYKAEHRINLAKEVLEGLRCLFDVLLQRNLLYKEELSSLSGVPSTSTANPQFNSSEIEREDNSVLLQNTPVAEDKEEATPSRRRRLTRSSVSDQQQQQAANQQTDLQKTELETDEDGLKRVAQLFCKLEQHDTPQAKKPRLAAHLQTSLQNMTASSGRSTPTQLQNPQADVIMKEVNEWKLLPHDVMESGDIELFSTRYGAIYLLRLFVKLPEILKKMKLGEEKKRLLLSIFSELLSFMEEGKDRLFDSVAYVPCGTSKES